MNWISPIETGLVMGLIMAFSVYGLAIAFRLFNFPDLTIEGSFLLGAVGFAVAQKSGLGMAAATVVAVLMGALAGALTGLLHATFRMNKFLAAILVVSITYTLALRIMGSSNIGMLGSSTIFDLVDGILVIEGFSAGKILLLGGGIIFVGVLVLAALSSQFGLRLRVAGCNPEYARTLGINVTVGVTVGLAATNALAAISGVLLAVNQGFADVGLGQGVLIFALASMSLGERLISEKRHSVLVFILLSSILGSLAYQLLIAIAVRAGLNPIDLKLVTAILVLVLVVLRTSKSDDVFSSR